MMSCLRWTILGLACALAAMAISSSAQDAKQGVDGAKAPQSARQSDSSQPNIDPTRSRIRDISPDDYKNSDDPRKLVETVMMVRLAEELQLTEDETVVMVRRLRDLKDKMIQMRRGRSDVYRALKDALKNNAPSEEIEAKLAALLDYDRKMESFKQDHLADLSEGLSVERKAKLYVFLSEFENDMRHLVHQAQERANWRRGDGEGDGQRRERWSGYDRRDNSDESPCVDPSEDDGQQTP